jgi:myosin V
METTAVILRLRKLLEEEKSKGDSLENELTWIRNKSSSTSSAGDSIRLSELEVENEKLRQDYELLRNSISRGVEHQEMEAQYEAMIEELKRRRDECIQLRTILSQQSQSLSNHNSSVSLKSYEGNELADALQAQRNANKQLEEELQALTEMHKMKLIELTKEIDNLRNEKQQLEDIFHEKLENDNENDIMKLRQRESYLKVELSRLTDSYVHSQESLTSMRKQLQELNNRNHKLSNALRDNGLNDAMMMNGSINGDLVEVAKKKNHKLQGILKHQAEDEGKIIQRLVTDLTTRTAITLLPSLPAYILFMCIRYTDLLNADLRVKSLLTNFLLSVKKTFKSSDNLDAKILWIVNSIRLQELMMQYGGHEQYMRLNTDKQNEQQLKNFDLSEYEIVIKETINFMYEVLIQRMQESIKPHIVPAILYHDETTKGKKRRGINSIESPGAEQKTISEPQSLVLQLEHFYNRFFFFGLDNFYVEQVFEQLFYFICAVALNNLMLRRDLCTWKTGMQLKYNVGILESWVKEKKMVSQMFYAREKFNSKIFFF